MTSARDPKFSKKSLVTVERNVKGALYSAPDMWGPMTLDAAIQADHLTTCGGTVSVKIRASGGEYDGAQVYLDGKTGFYRVQAAS